jgi:hypothetical protein
MREGAGVCGAGCDAACGAARGAARVARGAVRPERLPDAYHSMCRPRHSRRGFGKSLR